ncbi:hypothetical protein V6N12_042851 [Hibiscus sabdariffa]|uniref:Uncharacterized protein n=1 Tax=Hibiscus sabdariffa TaxID=183260 RepID=A0ABR2AV04_9ROSI
MVMIGQCLAAVFSSSLDNIIGKNEATLTQNRKEKKRKNKQPYDPIKAKVHRGNFGDCKLSQESYLSPVDNYVTKTQTEREREML